MTEQEIAKHKEEIDKLSQIEMARLWRFTPSGHVYFTPSLSDYFKKKFQEKGWFTPEISKTIGW